MYKLRRIYKKILRIFRFIPVIYRFENWDFFYLLDYIEKGFQEFETFYSKEKNVSMLEERRLNIVKNLKICKLLLKRLKESDYKNNMYLKKIEHPETKFEDIGNNFHKMNFIYKNKDHENRYNFYMKKLWETEKIRREYDKELFCKIFKAQLEKWWD